MLTTSVGETRADPAPKGQPPRNLSGTRDHWGEAALEPRCGDRGVTRPPSRPPEPLLLTTAAAESFADRHIGPSAADVDAMLAALGVGTLDELLDQAVPAAIRDDKPLELEDAVSEPQAIARLRALADRNQVVTPLIGTGYHGTHTPGSSSAT